MKLIILACFTLAITSFKVFAESDKQIDALNQKGRLVFERTSNEVSYRIEWPSALDDRWMNVWAALEQTLGEAPMPIKDNMSMLNRLEFVFNDQPSPLMHHTVKLANASAFAYNSNNQDAVTLVVPLDPHQTSHYVKQFYSVMQDQMQGVYGQSPLITVPANILFFKDTPATGASASQAYNFSGNHLNGDITIAAPSGFEISIYSNSGFGSCLVITQSAWTVSNASVYVRFKPATTGLYSNVISHDSPDSATAFKLVTGTALEAPGGLDPASTNPTEALVGDKVTLNAQAWPIWRGNERSSVVVVGRFDDVDLTMDTIEGPASYSGSNTEFISETIQFAQPGTFYWALRVSYGRGNNFWYDAPRPEWSDLAVSPPSGASLAIKVYALQDPTGMIAEFDQSNLTGQVNLAWSKWNNRDVLVVRSSDERFAVPTPGHAYRVGDNIGSDMVIYSGSGTNIIDTSPANMTNYFYRFYSVNGDHYSAGVSVRVKLPDFRITNEGSSAYLINGKINPSLAFVRGKTYVLNIEAFGHPLWIKNSPVTGIDKLYTNGIVKNGTMEGLITFTVPANAPNQLYYICQFHGDMYGVINIRSEGVPIDMPLIPGGAFVMGDTLGDGSTDELPLHTNTISPFYIEKYEVTKALWDIVHAWALTNDYSFGSAGLGKGPNHPVHSVDWYDAIAWCNARSEREGLEPCFTNANGAVYKNASDNSFDGDCNWLANGYRLPTNAEWEKAARGGLAGLRFPWGDKISHDNANYYAYPILYSYDANHSEGYHSMFNDGNWPYTSPVGNFAPNGFGLYDVVGNVWEWCWDWHNPTYYSASPLVNPLGPSSGSYRLLRGGSWGASASVARLAARSNGLPYMEFHTLGFRCVRRY